MLLSNFIRMDCFILNNILKSFELSNIVREVCVFSDMQHDHCMQGSSTEEEGIIKSLTVGLLRTVFL